MIIISETLNPYHNLALEEYLLDCPDVPESILLLWQSAPAVIIGKNQNPWRECCLRHLRERGGVLTRRLSGGGAVYHDRGNLNCSLIVPRNQYQEHSLYDLVLAALRRLNLAGQLSAHHSMTIAGKKFCGHAICFRKNRVLHHCTLLISANLAELQRCLMPIDIHINTHAIPSVPAPVVNLTKLVPNLTVTQFKDILVDTYRLQFDDHTPVINNTQISAWPLPSLINKYSSAKWIYDITPPFTINVTQGSVHLTFSVKRGYIHKIFAKVLN